MPSLPMVVGLGDTALFHVEQGRITQTHDHRE